MRVAERPHFLFALHSIPAVELVSVAGVAAEFGHAWLEPLEQHDQRLRGDRVRVRLASSVVSVEITAESDTCVAAAERHLELTGELLDDWAHDAGPDVAVVM